MPPPVGPLRQPSEVDRVLPSVVFEVKLNEGGILVPPKRNDQYNPDEVANISRLGEDGVCQQLWVCNVFAYFINFMFSCSVITLCDVGTAMPSSEKFPRHYVRE
jgi:hypothetical protein